MRGLEEVRQALGALRARVARTQPPTVDLAIRPTAADPVEQARRQEFLRQRGEVVALRDELVAGLDRDLGKLESAAAVLGDQRAVFAEDERALRETIVRWLDLALAWSVGYWTAISLLVGWAMQRQPSVTT